MVESKASNRLGECCAVVTLFSRFPRWRWGPSCTLPPFHAVLHVPRVTPPLTGSRCVDDSSTGTEAGVPNASEISGEKKPKTKQTTESIGSVRSGTVGGPCERTFTFVFSCGGGTRVQQRETSRDGRCTIDILPHTPPHLVRALWEVGVRTALNKSKTSHSGKRSKHFWLVSLPPATCAAAATCVFFSLSSSKDIVYNAVRRQNLHTHTHTR